ncbi:glycoside hydrolase family 2 [Georgenia sp. TF02-10]|uniref:glycoside hydrolase family 2 protein n=1 Tax=Georgenia sp. TF02-10 TaxID=2917725 RepID=UPI001FA6C55F|nr:glycoside hydrolase family 2 TIM barrel-domain containing protein [Georgenia sp. TF02-10]UNX55717.1 glycoside hydrolase family 2 [Georgenia sp. TF02-10]
MSAPPPPGAGSRQDAPASRQDGTYPRPQAVRSRWADLCGTWDFAVAPPGGTTPGEVRFDRRIEVPFPPESPASGVGETGFLPEVWYRRTIDAADLRRAWFATDGAAGSPDGGPADGPDGGPADGPDGGAQGDRVLLHFGAVDYRATVWLDGQHLGSHEGGQTPFAVDITDVVTRAARSAEPGAPVVPRPLELVVRAQDDPADVAKPRGKQDWRAEPHAVWYHRTTGIWQPVWLEAVPALHIAELAWTADLPAASVTAEVRLSRRPTGQETLRVRLEHDGELLAEQSTRVLDQDVRVLLDLPRQHNGQAAQELLWSPERPTLVDATLTLAGPATAERTPGPAARSRPDEVTSYLGLRSAAVADGRFLLNDRPYYLRSVLGQGYWPQSHLAAPSAAALRAEVEAIKALGFNAVRVHQKAEDPRFLYWADRLGLAVWGEMASAYAFSARAVQQVTGEWVALVRRDRSHPCVVTWVPLNESWGVQHAAHVPAQRHYATGLANLTRAVDPTRPVVSNDGWEHTDSDIWSVHDYAPSGEQLRQRYGTADAVRELLAGGIGHAGRRVRLTCDGDRGQPLMLTEFGGVSYAADREEAWGYSTAADAEDFAARLRDLFDAVRACPPLAGFCYTQLTDTGQETNGLLDEDRRPKLPVEQLRALVLGDGGPG